MSRPPIPSHLIAGLSGGYLPNIAEHYDSRGAAVDALREFIDRADFDGTLKYRGKVDRGWVEIGEHEYAGVIDCPDPADCEVALWEEEVSA